LAASVTESSWVNLVCHSVGIVSRLRHRTSLQVLLSTPGRVLELNNELVELELTDFNFNDDVLVEQKMITWKTEVIVPKYRAIQKEGNTFTCF
jgi:hypothetical protein